MIIQFHLALGDRLDARKYDSMRNAPSHHQELESRDKATYAKRFSVVV
jgi:hypothetical protein